MARHVFFARYSHSQPRYKCVFFFIMNNNNVHADGGSVNTYRRLALQRDGAASITVRGAVFGTS